jgi:hypothetical protein
MPNYCRIKYRWIECITITLYKSFYQTSRSLFQSNKMINFHAEFILRKLEGLKMQENASNQYTGQ